MADEKGENKIDVWKVPPVTELDQILGHKHLQTKQNVYKQAARQEKDIFKKCVCIEIKCLHRCFQFWNAYIGEERYRKSIT